MHPIDVILIFAGAVLIGIGTGQWMVGAGALAIGLAVVPSKRP